MSPCNKLDAWNNEINLNLFYLFIFYNVWITKNQFKHKFKCKICGKPNRFAEVDVEGLKILSSYTKKTSWSSNLYRSNKTDLQVHTRRLGN